MGKSGLVPPGSAGRLLLSFSQLSVFIALNALMWTLNGAAIPIRVGRLGHGYGPKITKKEV